MPMIDLTIPTDTLSEEHQAELVSELTRIFIKWEGGTEVPGYEYAAWAFVHEVRGTAIAGKMRGSGKAPLYRVVCSMPKGSMNDGRKAGMIAEVTEAIMRIEPRERWKHDPNRVWCIINDVPDGDWGVAGKPTTLRDLVNQFGATLPAERHEEFEFGKR
jgi:phenylpyruvate tautomerase PptA (4-oxalocrotonate tautomerase family)